MAKKKLEVKFHLLEGAKAPTKGTEGSAGWDLYSADDYYLRPGDFAVVKTGVIAQAPPGYHFKLAVRSSLTFKKGITLANAVGIIDEDYAGPNDLIGVPLFKLPIHHKCVGTEKPIRGGMAMSHRRFEVRGDDGRNQDRSNFYEVPSFLRHTHIRKGERVAQLLIEKTPTVVWSQQDARNFVEADRGGFGSTGEL